MGFSWQEYWNGLPFPPPGDLPDSGTEPGSLMSPAFAGVFFTTSATWGLPQTLNFKKQKKKSAKHNKEKLNKTIYPSIKKQQTFTTYLFIQ